MHEKWVGKVLIINSTFDWFNFQKMTALAVLIKFGSEIDFRVISDSSIIIRVWRSQAKK